jgi:phosphate transport system protein
LPGVRRDTQAETPDAESPTTPKHLRRGNTYDEEGPMRDSFHEDLDKISEQLVEMTRLAGSAMSRATTALLDADLHLAESVIAADEKIDELRRELDERSIDLLARQQPVATDLRMVVTAMRMSSDLERMGDVAKVARLRYPDSAIHPVMRSTVLEMGQVAERIVAKAGSVIAGKDIETALALERDDDEMDRLHRDIFNMLMDGKWKYGTEAAVDATLVGRYYERFADHAVSVARRVVYLVTGEYQSEGDLEDEDL